MTPMIPTTSAPRALLALLCLAPLTAALAAPPTQKPAPTAKTIAPATDISAPARSAKPKAAAVPPARAAAVNNPSQDRVIWDHW